MAEKNLEHIFELSREEKQKFLNSFDLVLFDCDGVVWSVFGSIPQAGDAINLLKGAGKKYKFVSNNSIRSDAEYISKFEKIGLENVKNTDVVHPAKSIAEYLKKCETNNLSVYSMAQKAFNDHLMAAGFNVIKTEVEIYDNLQEFYGNLRVKEKVVAVIFDTDLNMNLFKMAKSEAYLEDPECKLIVGGIADSVFLTGMAKCLSDRTGKEEICLGKPSQLFGDYLIETFSIKNPKRVLFIGDSLQQDISFGNKCGFQTLLVLSGSTKKQDLFKAKDDKKPNYYADSLADFVQFFNDASEVNSV